jgi:hypothetical protein
VYRAERYELVQQCLRIGVWVEEIIEVLHRSPQYQALARSSLPAYLREDLPIKCLLAGLRAFWR